jgi:hypothetical protein
MPTAQPCSGWPAIFRHIRSVRILRRDGRRRLIAVRATWHGVPIGWTAIQTNEPEPGRMTLHHVSPLTRGSVAVWEVAEAPAPPGGPPSVDLLVRQQVTVPLPLIGAPLASRFVGGWVGRELGQSMLDRVKEIAEGGSLAGRD